MANSRLPSDKSIDPGRLRPSLGDGFSHFPSAHADSDGFRQIRQHLPPSSAVGFDDPRQARTASFGLELFIYRLWHSWALSGPS